MKIKLAWAFMVVTLACLCWSANGKSLVWTGASSSNWSGSGNWKDTSTGAAASFANGDDVLFDDSAVNKLVCTDGDVAPNSVIFDSSETYVLSNRVNGAHTYGLAEGTKSFVKRGSGTLEIWAYGWGDNQGNCMTCGVDIVAGTIKAMVANKVNHLGNCKKPYTVTVRSGGRLWGAAHNLFGSSGNPAEAKMDLVVEDGGVVQLGSATGPVAYASFANLTLMGPNALEYYKGYQTTYDIDDPRLTGNLGIMRVFGKYTFLGDAPYHFTQSANAALKQQYFVVADAVDGNPQTEFDVPDLTDDDTPDVVFDNKIISACRPSAGADRPNGGFVKTGLGRMVIDNRDAKLRGNIVVRAGELDVTNMNAFVDHGQTVLIQTNAILRLRCRNVFQGSVTNNGEMTFRIDHGKLVIDESTGKTSCQNRLGSLYLDNAELDLTSAYGAGKYNDYGLGFLQFGKMLSFKGERPYDIKTDLDLGSTEGSKTGLVLNDAPRTEIYVEDITNSQDVADLTIRLPLQNRVTNDRSPYQLAKSGFVKTGAGTMLLTHEFSSLYGDVTVKEGTLWLRNDRWSSTANMTRLGDMTRSDRQVVVEADAVLRLTGNNLFAGPAAVTNDALLTSFVIRGKLVQDDGSMNRFGFLIFDGGSFEFGSGRSGKNGFLMVDRLFGVLGNKPVALVRDDSKSNQKIDLNGVPTTVFNIADASGDGASDLLVGVWLGRPSGYSANVRYGVVKIGDGTMSYSAPATSEAEYYYDGDTLVSNGTFRVDGVLAHSCVRVSEGAYIGGTGSVANVVLESGAGFSVLEGDVGGLTVTGPLALPARGVVNVCTADRQDLSGTGERLVFVAKGDLSGVENLSAWQIKHNGDVSSGSRYRLKLRGKTLTVKDVRGMMMIVR